MSSTGPKPVTDRNVVTAGAGGIYSTPKDMARYLAALLGGGANEHGTVLKPATLAAMFAPQFQPDPRIPGMGLAFWRRTAGGHPVVEHQGIIPGFDSQIMVAPDDGVRLMAFTNGASHAVQWMPCTPESIQVCNLPTVSVRGCRGPGHVAGPLRDGRRVSVTL